MLPSLPQKAAFLNALQPRDRLRLLGMVSALVCSLHGMCLINNAARICSRVKCRLHEKNSLMSPPLTN